MGADEQAAPRLRRLLLVKHSLPAINPSLPANQWRLSKAGTLRCQARSASGALPLSMLNMERGSGGEAAPSNSPVTERQPHDYLGQLQDGHSGLLWPVVR